jgi:predicted aconitase with swiveling domain
MRCLLDGEAIGPLQILTEPLSFWGGVEVESGLIIDPNHPQFGDLVSGCILGLPHGRGSSSSATVLAEMIRIGSGPVGLILSEPDQILVAGGYVANFLYAKRFVVSVGHLPEASEGVFRLDVDGLVQVGE